MGFREIIQKLRGDSNNDGLKDRIKEIELQTRAEETVGERKLSANERELNRIYKELREKKVKDELEVMRKERQEDIDFGHNPIHTKNIMSKRKGDWEIMKDRQLFKSQGNMFSNQKNIFVPKKKR